MTYPESWRAVVSERMKASDQPQSCARCAGKRATGGVNGSAGVSTDYASPATAGHAWGSERGRISWPNRLSAPNGYKKAPNAFRPEVSHLQEKRDDYGKAYPYFLLQCSTSHYTFAPDKIGKFLIYLEKRVADSDILSFDGILLVLWSGTGADAFKQSLTSTRGHAELVTGVNAAAVL